MNIRAIIRADKPVNKDFMRETETMTNKGNDKQ